MKRNQIGGFIFDKFSAGGMGEAFINEREIIVETLYTHTYRPDDLPSCGVVRFSPGCPWGNGRILSLSHDLPAC